MAARIHEFLVPTNTTEFECQVPVPGECFGVAFSFVGPDTAAMFVIGDDADKRMAKFVWLCAEDKMPAETGAFRYIGTLLLGEKHKHLVQILHVKEKGGE